MLRTSRLSLIAQSLGKRAYSVEVNKSWTPYVVQTYSRPEVFLNKGKGSLLWDSEGKKYIDFTAGIAVTSLGHADDEIAEILKDQGSLLLHTSNLYYSDWMVKAAHDIIETTKRSGGMKDAHQVFFANSGTEANEAALKFARKWGNTRSHPRNGVVSFGGSFHGRTFGSLSATATPKYQEPFAPMVPGFKHGTINDTPALSSLITEDTCGVIVEPIQGEGGINSCSVEFLTALRRRCDEVDAVLIYDEIQCGLGRTGDFWAHQILPQEAHPDILTTAKSLGNGFPIGATIVSERIGNVLAKGDHGSTYGGNPLGARIACNTVARLSDAKFLEGVKERSKVFTDRFSQLQTKYPKLVTETRGRGLILGLQLTVDVAPIIDQLREKGLLVVSCGTNTLRFVPALNIPTELIEEGLDIIDATLSSQSQ
ncbi:acetylornithine transaminase [Sugiyamaella lignohabitans]|uniref:Acetylornithine aminotransferase, mitochondrial n=1 Tax=Sugiyamaella lignohabitans TaxID=796027 RepID=A0A167FC39_9ASCO|nr:acetylornithine transaminase [Sugiyamaella lignohabitans]ANB15098.1 acetylornithine transaminase [Sugiyamaella lignohabitans]